MGTQYIIDTCAVIKYINSSLPSAGLDFLDAIIDEKPTISFVTEIELLVWTPKDESEAHLLSLCEEFIAQANIIDITREITKTATAVRKNYRLKLPDAIIAATALVYDVVLISDNDKDFKRIPDLKYINPMKL
jgi:predicted nucleic acid-binding protein